MLASVGELAGEVIVDIDEACGGVGFGARVRCEWVEVDVVYHAVTSVEDSLMRIKLDSMSLDYFTLTY